MLMSAASAGFCGAVGALAVTTITMRGESVTKRVTEGAPVAALAGVLAAVAQSRLHWSIAFALLLAQLMVLIHLAIHDARHQIVLNAVTYPGSLMALVTAPLVPGLSWGSALAGGLFAAAPFAVAAVIRPGGIGMGDIKLAFMVGTMAGLFPGYRVVLALGLSLGAALMVALVLLARRRATLQTRLPFGSFLSVAGMIVLATLNP